MSDSKVASVYYFETCLNMIGRFEKHWFATREAALQARERVLRENELEDREDPDDMVGEYGEVSSVEEVLVPLTPEGVLSFANDHALGDD